jgi:hypothetical protein
MKAIMIGLMTLVSMNLWASNACKIEESYDAAADVVNVKLTKIPAQRTKFDATPITKCSDVFLAALKDQMVLVENEEVMASGQVEAIPMVYSYDIQSEDSQEVLDEMKKVAAAKGITLKFSKDGKIVRAALSIYSNRL